MCVFAIVPGGGGSRRAYVRTARRPRRRAAAEAARRCLRPVSRISHLRAFFLSLPCQAGGVSVCVAARWELGREEKKRRRRAPPRRVVSCSEFSCCCCCFYFSRRSYRGEREREEAHTHARRDEGNRGPPQEKQERGESARHSFFQVSSQPSPNILGPLLPLLCTLFVGCRLECDCRQGCPPLMSAAPQQRRRPFLLFF